MEKVKLYVNEAAAAAGGAWSSCNYAAEQLNNGLFNPSWENSMDQSDPFESTLSSIVSSPVAATAGGGEDSFMIRELIGRLGTICNSGGAAGGDVSPQSYLQQHPHSNNTTSTTNNSCYTTPVSSSPKLNLSIMRPTTTSHPNLDPGFAERAATLSCFGTTTSTFGLHRNRSKVSMKPGGSQHGNSDNTPQENPDSKEGSSVSDANPRKRKSVPRPKVKDTPPSINEAKVVTENEESNSKRSKQEETTGNENDSGKSKTNNNNNNNDNNNNKDNSKAAEPPKDYIHVRARRGQATDSHSLAERVRREKISERMKLLQELVPGCNKVTGKAVMLDEIINYVQSLQRQVEFLSMKLAAVNPRMDLNLEALLSKDMFQSRGALQNALYQVDSSAQAFPFGYQPQPGLPLNGSIPNNSDSQLAINPLTAALHRNQNVQLPSSNGYGENPTQAPSFWEDDLQSLVQMAFNQNHQSQSFHGSMATAQMKIEL